MVYPQGPWARWEKVGKGALPKVVEGCRRLLQLKRHLAPTGTAITGAANTWEQKRPNVDPFFSVQVLLGWDLVPEQEHLFQPEHLQLDDVSEGHGDQDCWGAGVRQSGGLSQVSSILMQLQ